MNAIIFDKVFPCLALILFSLCEVFQGQSFIVLGFFLVLPYFFRQWRIGRFYVKGTYVRPFLLLTILGGLLNMPLTGYGIGGLLLTVAMIGLAVFCIDNPKICIYVSLFLLLYTFYFLYKSIFIYNIELNSLYGSLGLSKNYPGFLIVGYTVFYALNKYRVYRRLPLLLPLVGVYFAFWLDGRSSFGIMILLSLFCVLKNANKKYYNYFVLIVFVSLFLFFFNFLLEYYEMSRLSEGVESSRSKIWSVYFEYMDFPNFILGCDSASFPIINQYGGNPHNSFLNFHHRMGIIGFLTFIYIIFVSIKKYITQRKFIILVLMLFLMARMFFDSVIVANHDFIFYSFMFLPFLEKNKCILLNEEKNNMNILLKLL